MLREPKDMDLMGFVERLKKLCVIKDNCFHIPYRDDDLEGAGYTIPLERCDTSEKLLGWISHLCEKNWMDRLRFRAFITRAEETGITINHRA